MILAYRIFTTLIYPLLLIFVYLRKLLKKEDDKRYKEKILISHFKIDKKFKSKLDPKYFLFYKKAFELIVQFYLSKFLFPHH